MPSLVFLATWSPCARIFQPAAARGPVASPPSFRFSFLSPTVCAEIFNELLPFCARVRYSGFLLFFLFLLRSCLNDGFAREKASGDVPLKLRSVGCLSILSPYYIFLTREKVVLYIRFQEFNRGLQRAFREDMVLVSI